jgi:hypothetical protein
MAKSHIISALIKKRSELSGEIEHYEKIIISFDNLVQCQKAEDEFTEIF